MKLINYSGNQNKSGIYCIRNLINNKVYIGSTKCSFESRKNRHLRNLKNNTHYNEYMQNSWNKYGDDNFNFEVLFLCEPEMCIKYEADFIKLYSSNLREYGYNIACVVDYKYNFKRSEIHNNEKSLMKLKKSIELIGANTKERGICKPFNIYDLNGNFLKRYESGIEYNIENGTHARSMLSITLNKRKLYYNGNILLFSNDELSEVDILNAQKENDRRKPKKIYLFDLNNTYIDTFDSAKLCADFLKCKEAEIRMCCLGKRSRIKKYITKYEKL